VIFSVIQKVEGKGEKGKKRKEKKAHGDLSQQQQLIYYFKAREAMYWRCLTI